LSFARFVIADQRQKAQPHTKFKQSWDLIYTWKEYGNYVESTAYNGESTAYNARTTAYNCESTGYGGSTAYNGKSTQYNGESTADNADPSVAKQLTVIFTAINSTEIPLRNNSVTAFWTEFKETNNNIRHPKGKSEDFNRRTVSGIALVRLKMRYSPICTCAQRNPLFIYKQFI
jgi:hypothetical protein